MDQFDDDQPALSKGFFQSLMINKVQDGFQPVLQVIESRVIPSIGVVRMRLSDGMFTYSNCIASLDIGNRLESDGFTESHGIIKVIEFSRSFANNKVGFSIINYVPLQLNNQIIGDPKPHSGNPDEYRGIENHLTNMNANRVDFSPSRKRGLADQNGSTPNKRANNMPSGGVFSERPLDISLVTPYVSKFRICGMVSFKEAPRTINTRRGPSSVFSFVLTDATGTSIKISAFSKECDKFSELVQDGCTFYVTCSGNNVVRETNKRFNSTGHTYEITLNSQCDIEICTDRDIGTPACKLNCIPLSDVKMHKDECVDVLAVVDKVEEATTITARSTGKELIKRNVTLIDDSCVQIQLTLWADAVEKITPDQVGHVLGIKGASVREFNGGFSLSFGASSSIITAPDGNKSNQLYQWYIQERPGASVGTLTAEGGGNLERDCRAIAAIKETNLANLDKGMYVTVVGFVNMIKSENLAYASCKFPNCKKKVTSESKQWDCREHGLQDSHSWLYMANMEIADFTGLSWVTLFDEAATQLFGIKASELMDKHQHDRAGYDAIIQDARFKAYEFRFRVSSETYNDNARTKWSCASIRPLTAVVDRYSKFLQHSFNAVGNGR